MPSVLQAASEDAGVIRNLEALTQVGADLARDGDRAREDVDLRAVGARHLERRDRRGCGRDKVACCRWYSCLPLQLDAAGNSDSPIERRCGVSCYYAAS